jgi:ribonuclease HI
MSVLRCFTDGAAKSNRKDAPAGWAYYFPKQGKCGYGNFYGTNNQAELQAVIQGLKRALKFKFMKPPIEYTSVLVITDSKYVIGIMEGNKPKTNLDLIQELFDTRDKLHCKVGFEYVSAHTKKTDYVSSCNNVVDGLASAAAERLKKTGQTEIKHGTIKMSSK